jgi:hypothetical protein
LQAQETETSACSLQEAGDLKHERPAHHAQVAREEVDRIRRRRGREGETGRQLDVGGVDRERPAARGVLRELQGDVLTVLPPDERAAEGGVDLTGILDRAN